MPDTDAPSRSDSSADRRASASTCPSLVPQPSAPRATGRRLARARAARAVRLEAELGARRSARPCWRTARRRNRLLAARAHHAHATSSALRGRRVDDVMVPRADIIAVQQDIPLGELIKVFEGAGHSRLVVYNDTLDDPVGMVHIRDVIGYMARARAAERAAKTQAQEAVPGRPRSQGDRPLGAAVGREDHPRDPVRAALDAGDRSARQDAGDAHPSRAGDRRIRRHRRHRLDRGHRRADRRRHRGRARRGRHARRSCARPTAPSSPMRARSSRTSSRSSARNSMSAMSADEVDTLAGYVDDAGRPASVARRGRAGPGRLRDRGARRRSAPPEEACASRARNDRPNGASAARAAPRSGRRATQPAPRRPRRGPSRRPTRDRRDRS